MGELISEYASSFFSEGEEPPSSKEEENAAADDGDDNEEEKRSDKEPTLEVKKKAFEDGHAHSARGELRLAHKCFARAALPPHNDPVASKFIGDLYMAGGRDHPVDERRALRWFLRAAEGGDKPSQYLLGLHCLRASARLEEAGPVLEKTAAELAPTATSAVHTSSSSRRQHQRARWQRSSR